MSWRRRDKRLEDLEARGIKPAFLDPEGERFGIPTYPYHLAPKGLLTRRQLRVEGLAPEGHDPVAQIYWKHHGALRLAYLYDAGQAAPKRVPTAAQLAAVRKALEARMTCQSCGQQKDYCIPTSLGECPDCHEGARSGMQKNTGKEMEAA